MFFKFLSDFIFKRKILLLILIAFGTLIATFYALKIQPSYDAKVILPHDNKIYQKYLSFIEKFGADDNTIILGIKTEDIFEENFLHAWNELTENIRNINHVKEVVSITHFYNIIKDKKNKKFKLSPIEYSSTKTEVQNTEIKQIISSLPFYEGTLWQKDNPVTLISIVLENKIGRSSKRNLVIKEIDKFKKDFEKKVNIKTYTSGMPYVRTKVSDFVLNEFLLFLGITILLSAIILWVLLHNIYSMIFPIISVCIGVIWSVAFMVWWGFNLTLLTGLIPPLMVIIGIPNSVLIINKYKSEWNKKKSREQTLRDTLRASCFSTFLANFTTAIGFFVFYFTGSTLLEEFGIIASISVMTTWFVCLVIIPTMYHEYSKKINLRGGGDFHSFPILKNFLHYANRCSYNTVRRRNIFIIVFFIIITSGAGIYLLKIDSFVIDDLDKTNPILRDIKFFENNFQGVVPLEIIIDTKQKKGVEKISFLRRLEKFEKGIAKLDYVSSSLSLSQALKYINQSFFNGNPKYYRIPSKIESDFIALYLKNSDANSSILKNYVDSLGQETRVSFRMNDIGSIKTSKLYVYVDSIAQKHLKKYEYYITGTGKLFVEGTTYLIKNLIESLLLAIVIISVLMWFFFRSFKMLFIATLPNLVPLALTMGIMGFAGIPIKPSTILIFSIALGIASDQTIYILSKLKTTKDSEDPLKSVILEVGTSMAYITFLLILGFGVFIFSDFNGTVYLGLLLAITLFSTFFSNIFFLPAMLRKFNIKL